MKGFREIFSLLDRTDSGSVGPEEFAEIMKVSESDLAQVEYSSLMAKTLSFAVLFAVVAQINFD